jgi:hypothetical protein
VTALLLTSPSLATGWVADDWLHQVALREEPSVSGIVHDPLNLFSFARGDFTQARQLMDEGVFPWWADPRAVLSFFRPLSSLSHWLDRALFPDDPRWAHAHNLLWFAALLVVVHALYRRFATTSTAALLAFVLFVLDDAHAATVGWIANRNVLMALTLSLPAVLLHDAERRGACHLGRWYATALLALGLCAGEAALVTVGYLVAYAAFIERGPWTTRIGASLRYVGVCAIWALVYVALGYGARHSGLYVDPLRNPLEFAAAVAERLPVLALSQLALPWADLWEVYPLVAPALRPVVFALALVVLALFCWSLRADLRRRPELGFWLAGALLGALPVCATFPHDRLLLGLGIGVMPALATLLSNAWRRRSTALVVALASVHLVLAPVLLALRSAHVADLREWLARADARLPPDAALADRTLILLNPPLDPFAAYLPLQRAAERRPRPARLLWLATAVTPIRVTTLDEHRLLLQPRAGFLSNATQLMLRRPRHAFAAGDRVELGAASFEVTAVADDGRPVEVLVTLRAPLSSPELVWMQWRDDGYEPFAPPPPGTTVELPAADFRRVLFHEGPAIHAPDR